MDEVIKHYDKLIEENNDPFNDPEPLRQYMNKWDGQEFLDELKLSLNKTVLEIGVGTGRLASKTAPFCGHLIGIDISPKTIKRAKENLSNHPNITLLTGDFLSYSFEVKFDTIYSSLTFMHIKNKQQAIDKVAHLLKNGGQFVLSIGKNQSPYIDMGDRKLQTFPDNVSNIKRCLENSKLKIKKHFETEFSQIVVAFKQNSSII